LRALDPRRRAAVALAIGLALLGAHAALRGSDAPSLDADGTPTSEGALAAAAPDSALALFAGAFRPLAADVLWIRIDAHERAGRHEEIVPLARLLLALDPRSIGAWWTLASAIGTDTPAFEDAPAVVWRWRRQGLLILAEGSRRNPGSWFLLHRTGLVLEQQVGRAPGLEPLFREDKVVNPDGLTVREAALRLYRRASAIDGHPAYVDEAIRRLEGRSP